MEFMNSSTSLSNMTLSAWSALPEYTAMNPSREKSVEEVLEIYL